MPKKINYFLVFFILWLTSCEKEIPTTDFEYKKLGTSAHNLLSASVFSFLIVEISYMPGFAPTSETIYSLKTFLSTYLDKPLGIQIRLQPIAASEKTKLTLNDVVQIEKRRRTAFTSENIMTVHVLITDNEYNIGNTLAISYWNTSICLFGKKIRDVSDRSGQTNNAKLMAILMQHEFGHLLGLVGQGTPMQTDHRDAAHGAHCSNRSCLMYYGIETAESLGNNTPIPILDAQCRADLKANGGK